MTRGAAFGLSANNYMDKAVSLNKMTTTIMGRVVESTKNAVQSFGHVLNTGVTRQLQSAASFLVQTGEYLKQQPHAFANIADQICKAPAPKPAPS